jgi:hyperosmotically inducible periplasmic protein
MSTRFARIIPLALAAMVLSTSAVATASDSRSPGHHIAASVARAIEQLPEYGVFDLLTFTIDDGTVTLDGHASRPELAAAAVAAIERLGGINRVVNKVQPLPTSAQDEWIRLAVFHRLYEEDFLTRYANGGRYLIHIVVRNGHVTLVGVVDDELDKHEAAIRARAAVGSFAVDNQLIAFTR